MNKMLLGLALTSASVCTALPAHASTSTNLTIKGQITPPACDLSFTEATVDFGTRTFGSLDFGGTILPTQTTTLNIECSGATRVSISASDNRPGTAIAAVDVTAWPNLAPYWAPKTIWGLGTTGPSDARIGGLEVAISPTTARINGTLTNTNLRVLGAPLGTSAWDNGIWGTYIGYFNADRHYSFGQAGLPMAVSNVSLPLLLSAVITRPANLPAADEIELDGSLTLSLHYL